MRFSLRKNSSSSTTGKPKKGFASTGKRKEGGKWMLVLFGLIFAGAGSFFLWMGSIQPYLKSVEAQNWVATPCIIEKSYVKTHRGSDSTTYSVQVYFQYEWEGKSYRSTTYSFNNFSSSGKSAKEATVRGYPVGAERVCYVNPNRPEEAYLQIGVDWVVFAIGGMAALFIAIGVGIAGFGLRRKSLPENTKFDSSQTADDITELEEVILQPHQKRGKTAIFAVFIAIFWNAISVLPIFFFFKEYREGNPEWFLLIIGSIFVSIGIVIIAGAGYSILALANPRPEIRIRPGTLRPGRSYRLEWELKGSISRLEDLRFILEGVEIARYRRGTRSVTDRNVFFQQVLHETTNKADYMGGHTQFLIPDEMVPSFASTNNEIQYQLICKGKIRRWPDLNDPMRIKILPTVPQKP